MNTNVRMPTLQQFYRTDKGIIFCRIECIVRQRPRAISHSAGLRVAPAAKVGDWNVTVPTEVVQSQILSVFRHEEHAPPAYVVGWTFTFEFEHDHTAVMPRCEQVLLWVCGKDPEPVGQANSSQICKGPGRGLNATPIVFAPKCLHTHSFGDVPDPN